MVVRTSNYITMPSVQVEPKKHANRCLTKINGHCDCDGYHTFDELYEHRIALFLALARLCRRQELKVGQWPDQPFVWRSKRHSDGELCFGTGTQYILGIGNFEGQQITYHIPIERWDEADFAETLEKSPKWDGHTSDDVLARLAKL